MTNPDYDVLIAGARVAGSSLALMLGDLGYRVLLIDRATFPSPANSTHFFRGNGFVGTLARVGLLEDVLALDCPPFRCEYWYLHGASSPEITPPQDPGGIGFNLSVRREPLDALLVGRSKAHKNIDVWEHTRFIRPVWEDGRVVAAIVDTDGVEVTIATQLVIGADGQHSRVARAVGAAAEIEDEPIRVILYRYVTGLEGPPGGTAAGPEFSVVENDIAYAFPSDAGVACVGVSFALSNFGGRWGEPEAVLERGLRRHPGLAERLLAASPVSKVMAQGRDRSFVRVPAGPGWALVGDAGLRQDPWTGRGMDFAGIHAAFLADAIDEWLSGKVDESTALATYHRRRNEHGLPFFDETQRLGRDLRQMEMMQGPEA